MRTHLDSLIRKEVVVRASGITYKGVLLEVTSDEVHLRGPTGFITISMDRVASIKAAKEKLPKLDPERSVSRSFYDADLMDPNKKKPEDQ